MSDNENREQIADNIFEQVRSSYLENKNNEAIRLLHKLISEFSEHFDLWNLHLWLGKCYYEIEDGVKAVNHLKLAKDELVKLITPETEICYLQILDYMGRSYWLLEDYDSAVKYLDESEELIDNYDVKNWGIDLYHFRIIKGRVYLWHSRFDDALEQFMMAKQLHPSDGSYIDSEAALNYEIGLVYHHSLNHEKAKEYFDKVNMNDLPEKFRPQFLFNLSIHSGLRGEYSKALVYFKKLESQGVPDEFAAELYNMVARAQYEQGNFDESRRYSNKSKEYPAKHEQLRKSIEELSRLIDIK